MEPTKASKIPGRMDATKRVPTRTAATIAGYRKTYVGLLRQAGEPDPSGVSLIAATAWFVSQHEVWSRRTIGVYAASLRQGVEDAVAAGSLEPETAAALLSDLADKRPAARVKGPKRTSARKRRSCSWKEIARVRADLRGADATHAPPGDLLVAQLLLHGSLLGLRPCEWARARIDGETLIVRNAKATNGRGCGETRSIELLGLYADPKIRESLTDLIIAMNAMPDSEVERRRAMDRLSARLARACERQGVARISLYTLRHVALATAKRLMTAAEVAAFAGHAVDRTAGQHYAKRRGGLPLRNAVARPTTETVARVRITEKASRPESTSKPAP